MTDKVSGSPILFCADYVPLGPVGYSDRRQINKGKTCCDSKWVSRFYLYERRS